MISAYPNVYNIGHRALNDLFITPVRVEEKIDGSQISFGRDDAGRLFVRSKGKDQYPVTDKLFDLAIAAILSLPLTPGWVYRGEYLRTPRHNVLVYDRVPHKHIILFDIDVPGVGFTSSSMATRYALEQEAERLGLEVVPLLKDEYVPRSVQELQKTMLELLDYTSILGGQKIEGVVLKNPSVYGTDKKFLIGKFVSERFKESHREQWGRALGPDFVTSLGRIYNAVPRWEKAIIHLRESGQIQDAPQDIGPLLKELNLDLRKECKEEIANALFEHFWKQISKESTRGFPEWYKERLMLNTQIPQQEPVAA